MRLEIVFYDALAENESARQLMGEPTLRFIAHELVQAIKANVRNAMKFGIFIS